MPRFQPIGRKDDPSVDDGDALFLGFRSRVQPAALPPGVARFIGNGRCDRGTFRPRQGARALATDLALANPPVVLDFTLPTAKTVSSITRVGTTATATTAAAHGWATGDVVAIEGATGGDATYYNGDFTITVTGTTTFTYTMTGTPGASAAGTLKAYKGARIFAVYDDLVRGSCTFTATDLTGGIVLATTNKAYLYREGVSIAEIGYPVGETCASGDPCSLHQFLGNVYLFRGTAKGALVWDGDTANDFVAVTSGAHPSGGTLIRMPQVSWGLDFTRRLVLPYSRDEIILSDFGDADTYDTQYGELRILPGGSDYLIGVHPYQDLRLVVLYRQSVHSVELDTTLAAPSAVREITRAFGCAARRSVANCGDAILWLSDGGVTGLQIQSQLQLIPFSRALSDAIADQIATINWAYASGAVGIFWNNRYYLAVPTGTSVRNNTVLVFNFLNRSETSPLGEWESVDTYPGDFDVQAFHVLNYGGAKRLHAATSYGYVFLLEDRESDQWGNPASGVGDYAITGRLHTRDFILGTRERKRFVRARANLNLATGDAYTLEFVARNPDRRTTIQTYAATATTDTDSALRVPGVRGSAGTLELTTTAGRPEVRSLALEATTADRADTLRT